MFFSDFNHRLDEKMTPDDERNMYFDFNATTPMDPAVISSISQAMTSAWANPSSSSPAGVQARKLIDESRRYRVILSGFHRNHLLLSQYVLLVIG